jgi:hypothetical protein
MWVSKNSGMTTWKSIPCYKVNTVFDFAVESADVVYAIDDAGCSKTTNAGSSWGNKVRFGNTTDGFAVGARVSLAPNNDILVGGSTGSYAVSTDGGATFAYTKPGGPPLNEVFLGADPGYATNGIIYVAADQSVQRNTPGPPLPNPVFGAANYVISGIYVYGEGAAAGPGRFQPPPGPPGPPPPPAPAIVYVVAANGTDSELHRCLNLGTATATGKNVPLWSKISVGATDPAPPGAPFPSDIVTLDACPQALKLSAGAAGPPPMPGQPPPGPPPGPPAAPPAPKLWAVDTGAFGGPGTAVGDIYTVEDPLAMVSPTVLAPADLSEVTVNPRSGAAYDVTFSWERQVTEVNKMDIQIATDPAFDAIILSSSMNVNTDTVATVIGPTTPAPPTGPGPIRLMPGQTYYWRVRVSQDGPMYSPWSDTRELNVEGAIAFDIQSPVPGSTGVTITPTLVWTEHPYALHYEIEIAEEPTLATIELFSVLDIVHSSDQTFYKVEDEEALKYSTTYYWRVRAITGVAPPAPPGPPGGPPPPSAPSSEWLVGVFTTEAEPVEEEPTEIIVESPPVTVQPPDVTVEAPAAAIPAYLLWTIVGIGAVLLIALIVLIVRTRRVV